jgi:2'-5' RNA ligase
MARVRLGVALLVRPPFGDEIDGLRRAVGDPALDRVPVHLTLVPPVNVREEALPAALAVLRRAAATAPRRLTLTLGPVATFLPVNPVLYFGVGGDLEALNTLRDRVFNGPLERPLTWPFVPHVTLADQAGAGRIAAAMVALSAYQVEISFDRVHLLQEAGRGSGRRWVPLADATFGPAAIVGRGGLALELCRSEALDPEAAALVQATAGELPADCEDSGAGRRALVITARREGEVVGVSAAWMADGGGQIAVLVGAAHRGQGIGGHLLAAAESAVAEAGWSCRRLDAVGPAGFYAARSRWSVVPTYSNTIDE